MKECNSKKVQLEKRCSMKKGNMENVQHGKCVTRINTTREKGNMKRVQHTKRGNMNREQHQKSATWEKCNTKSVQHKRSTT